MLYTLVTFKWTISVSVCVQERYRKRESERNRERQRFSVLFLRDHVIKGQQDRQGFRVEVQYLEFGFRLRCVMKKAEFYSSSVSLCTPTKRKRKKTQKRATGLHLSLIRVHFDSFLLPAHWCSKFCFKSVSAHILNAALLWAAAVVAARRISHSPTFLPASRTLFSFLFFVFRVELSRYF